MSDKCERKNWVVVVLKLLFVDIVVLILVTIKFRTTDTTMATCNTLVPISITCSTRYL